MIIIDDEAQEMLFCSLVLRDNLKQKLEENTEPLLKKDFENAIWKVEQDILKMTEKIVYSQKKVS